MTAKSLILAAAGNAGGGGGGGAGTPLDWTTLSNPWTNNISRLVYNPSEMQYVAFSTDGQLIYSYDAVDWAFTTALVSAGWPYDEPLIAAVWTGSSYVVGGILGTIAVSVPGSGVSQWTVNTNLIQTWGGGYQELLTLIWGSGQLVALGNNPTKVATSTNGSSWSNGTNLDNSYFSRAVIWTGDFYIAVGAVTATAWTDNFWYTMDSGSPSQIEFALGYDYPKQAVLFQNNIIAASASSFAKSTAGSNDWVFLTSISDIAGWGSFFLIQQIGASDTTLVAIGQAGKFFSSQDGVSWVQSTNGPYLQAPSNIIWDGSRFVVGDSDGYIYASL